MTVGDIGVVIVVELGTAADPYTVPAGSVGTLLAKPGYPIRGAAEQSFGPVTFSIDGSTAFYTTQGQGLDFQSAGNWVVRVRINEPNGFQFTSPPGQFDVLPA